MDEDTQPGQGAVAPGATGTRLSPGGVGSAPTGAPTPGAPAAGGQFATLQSYLTANQGQAAPLANKITSGIQNQYNTLQGQNASTLSGIQGQVAQGSTPENQDILAQEAANPVSFASNPSNIQSFQKQLSDQYTGPTSAESTADFTKQQNAVNNAIATGTAQTGTEAGREQLLSQNEARPTTGVTALNSAILTQSPDYLSQVQGAYKPFSNLLSSLSSGAASINSQIGQATSQAQDASQKANAQIAQQTQDLQANLQNELGTAQSAIDKYNQGLSQYQTGVAANQPFNADLQASGLLSAFNISNPFAQNYSALATPTINTVANANDLATQQALNQLGGQNISLINPNAPVGGYSTPGTVPGAPDISALLDKLALAEAPNLNILQQVQPGYAVPTNAVDISKALSQDRATLSERSPNYASQINPFENLLAQLSGIYGNQYTTPGLYGTTPIPGTYTLKS